MSIIANQPLLQASPPYQARLLLGNLSGQHQTRLRVSNLKGHKARLRVGNLKGRKARLRVGNLKGSHKSV